MNTDIEDLLRQGMERCTADLRAPAGLTRRAARRRRRRLARRSTGAVAAALTAGVIVVLAVVVPGTGARVAAADYVVRRVDSALSAAEPGDIAQIVVTSRSASPAGGKAATETAEEWSYGDRWRSVRFSPAGRPVYDEGSGRGALYTLVGFAARTWARQRELGRPSGTSHAPDRGNCEPVVAGLALLFQPGLPGLNFSAGSPPSTVARSLRAAISCGTLGKAGRQLVDGIEAIKLTSRPGSPVAETIWVSPSTYLPVRLVVRPAPGVPAPSRPVPGGLIPRGRLGAGPVQETASITWLRPTPRNLARLTVPVPAGFRRVPLVSALAPLVSQFLGWKPTRVCLEAPAHSVCERVSGSSGAGHRTLEMPIP